MKRGFGILVFFILVSSIAYAQGFSGILKKLDEFEKRLETIEKKPQEKANVSQIQGHISKLQNSISVLPDKVESLTSRTDELDSKTNKIAEQLSFYSKELENLKEHYLQQNNNTSSELISDLRKLTAELKRVISQEAKPGPDIIPYGYFKLDLAYDETRTNVGNYVFWLNNVPAGGKKDNEMNITAKQTRIGLNLIFDEEDGKKVSAKFEGDFYGGGAENKNLIMLRHAFMKVEFRSFYLLAGQTSDIFSPLVPSTVNYIVLWNCGNIGYRRPQIQIGNKVKEGVSIAGAVARNIAGDVDGDNVDDGEDSPFPTIQGRISFVKSGSYNIGFSGHYGKMEYAVNGEDKHYESYSMNFHLNYIFSKNFMFKAEAFTGKTLSQFLGGIGQGFNAALDTGIKSTGGWLSAEFSTANGLKYNFGYGFDKPKKSNLSAGARDLNSCVYANLFKTIAKNTTIGLELSRYTTGYYDGTNSNKTSGLRLQTALIMKY